MVGVGLVRGAPRPMRADSSGHPAVHGPALSHSSVKVLTYQYLISFSWSD